MSTRPLYVTINKNNACTFVQGTHGLYKEMGFSREFLENAGSWGNGDKMEKEVKEAGILEPGASLGGPAENPSQWQ